MGEWIENFNFRGNIEFGKSEYSGLNIRELYKQHLIFFDNRYEIKNKGQIMKYSNFGPKMSYSNVLYTQNYNRTAPQVKNKAENRGIMRRNPLKILVLTSWVLYK